MPFTLVIAFVAALGGACLAESPHTSQDPVLAALEEVRHQRADLYDLRSSNLGTLATPAELAAAQPRLRDLFTAGKPLTVDFSDEMAAELQRNYTYYSFHGPSRSGLTPLGVTGAYVREIEQRPELIVISVEPSSPAAEGLKVDDVIIGVNGRWFRPRRDPRIPMGYALYESSTPQLDGRLTLHLVRGGKAMNVVIEMPVEPPYAETWPYDCPRSEKIADRLVRLVLEHDLDSGRQLTWPIFLLASGDDAALELARRHFYRRLKDEYVLPTIGHSWASSYGLLNLCEYYLLTGDSNVLPKIDHYRKILQGGQSGAGGWGHRCPCSGYGEVNSVGAVALCALALTRECGVEMDKAALAQNVRYFGRFACAGMPYGDHRSGLRCGGGNNGKAGTGALAFRFLGATDVGDRWSRSVAYMWTSPEAGHAEGIFNLMWDPLAAAFAPSEEFAVQMNNRIWYYEMARTRQGGIRFFRGGHFPYPVGQSTAVGLPYLLPRKKIYLTGAARSVFGTRPPDEKLAQAAQLFQDKKWARLRAELTGYLASPSPHHDYAQKLLDAYRRMEQHVTATLALVETTIEAGDLPKARQQLLALDKLLGERRPEISRLYERASAYALEKPRRRWTEVESQATVFAYDPNDPPSYDWEFILPLAEESKDSQDETYYIHRPKDPNDVAAESWFEVDFKPNAWKRHRGLIVAKRDQDVWVRRRFTTIANPEAYKHLMVLAKGCRGELYLNGFKVADFGEGELYLRPGATSVLQRGPNVFAARLTGVGPTADLGIKASPPLLPDMEGLLDEF